MRPDVLRAWQWDSDCTNPPDFILAEGTAYCPECGDRFTRNIEIWGHGYCSRECTNRAKSRLKNAMSRGAAYGEMVGRWQIAKRDKHKCGICGRGVRKGYELDHIWPVSRGGPHEPGNLQVAHRVCNRKKWADANIGNLEAEAA